MDNSSTLRDFLINFAAGGVSGAISKTTTAPIERVKLIMQTQDANVKIISGEIPRYTGIINCFSRIYREQGLLSFWRGNFTNVLRYFPTQAFNFAFKDSIKSHLPKFNSKFDFWKAFGINCLSGGIAGAGSLCIVYPLDYARTRLASDVGSGRKDFKGLWHCLVKTSRGPEGVRMIYNGFGISVISIIIYRGCYFGLFDTMDDMNPFKNSESTQLRLASTFAAAQFAAINCAYISYPFDTVRRRIQMQSEKPREKWLYKNGRECFPKIYKTEGFTAFFKGAGANAFRSVGGAFVLVLYKEITTAIKGNS